MKLPHKALILLSLLLCAAMALLQSCTVEKMNAYHCKRCKTVDSVSTSIKESHKEEVKVDTAYVKIPADSAWLKAYIDCQQDSSKKYVPVIRYIEKEQTNKTKISATLKGNTLRVSANHLADSILQLTTRIHTQDSVIQSFYKKEVVPCNCPDCTPTKFIKFLTWTGGIFWGLLLLIVIVWIAWQCFKYFTPQGAVVNAGTTAMGWVGKLFGRR